MSLVVLLATESRHTLIKILRLLCIMLAVGIAGCGGQGEPIQSQASSTTPSSKNDEMLAELRKQNQLLEAQAERQKAEDAAKAKLKERETFIDDIAGRVAKVVNDHGQSVARIVNRAGGAESEKSRYDGLYTELRKLLIDKTINIEDDEKFQSSVTSTAEEWAKRKALQ